MPYPESIDLAVDVIGGRNTSIPPAQLPPGGSPDNEDVMYPEAGVRTRDGLLSLITPLAGSPSVNGLKSFVTPALLDYQLIWDSLGNLYRDYASVVSLISSGGSPNSYMHSTTLFGREYMAFRNNSGGIDFPRQYDGTNYDRVSQVGPGAAPFVVDYLPPAATVQGAGAGAPVNIAAAPNGAVTTDLTSYYVPPYPPYWMGGYFSYYATATYTTTAPHGLVAGNVVTIAGVTNAFFNQTNVTVLAVLSATSFKISLGSSTFQASGSGTVTGPGATGQSLQRVGNVVTATTAAAHGFQSGWTVQIGAFADLVVGGGITAITQQGGIVTVTTTNPHGLVPGGQVIVAGVTDTTYNSPAGQAWTVQTTPTPTTFTYAAITATQTSTGGTVSVAWNGTFTIRAVPSTTTFTYTHIGPTATTNAAGTATIIGNVTAGLHQISVAFVTRQGYYTKAAVPGSFRAGGSQLLSVTGIPIGPSNVTKRLLLFTTAISAPATTGLFFTTQALLIPDNTTTSTILDFTDTALAAGTNVQYLFGLIELGECSGVASYNNRTVWIGERNQMRNLLNLSFNGGWSLGTGKTGADVPLGWTNDGTYGNGGARVANGGVWLDAYQITGIGGSNPVGMITQGASLDYLGVPIFSPLVAYSARIRAKIGAADAGNLTIELYSTSLGSLVRVDTGVNSWPINSFGEVIVSLTTASTLATIPSDAVLRWYADSMTAGHTITIDSIEFFPTNTPVNTGIAWISYAFNPESFDATLSQVQIRPNDGQSLRGAFQIRGDFYLGKDRYLASITDDVQNEPSSWPVKEISNTIGICGPNAVDTGEEWAAFADRNGAYIFWGSDPVKVSQEIQEDASQTGKTCWNSINWALGSTIWTRIDSLNKRIMFGVPAGESVGPNKIFYMDYKFQSSGEDAAGASGAVYSMFSGKLLEHGGGRKWSLWNIAAHSCALMEQSDGTVQTWMGNAANNGKIYQLKLGQYSDDGVAINNFYETYGQPSVNEEQGLQLRSHRKLCDYISGRAIGSGTMNLSVISPYRTTAIRGITLSLNPAGDFERIVNVHGERLFFKVGTNAVGAWFQLERLVPMQKTDPTIAIRGLSA